jgi:hypothetical protein
MMSINKQFGIADLHLNLGTQSDIVYALLFLDTSRTIPSEDALWIHLRIPGSLGPHHIFLCGRDTSIVVFRLPIVYSSLSFDDPGDRSTAVQMTSSSTHFSRGFIEHHFEIELG